MKRAARYAIFGVLLFCSQLAFAQLFGVSTFEDCVLKNLPKARTESAEEKIEEMCRMKFPAESFSTKDFECVRRVSKGQRDPSAVASYEFDLPFKSSGGAEIKALIVEFKVLNERSFDRELVVKAQISSPINIQALVVSTYNEKKKV